MRSRGALIRTQSPTCSTAEHDASTLFLAPLTDFDTAQKASTPCACRPGAPRQTYQSNVTSCSSPCLLPFCRSFGLCADPGSSSAAILLLRRHQSRLEDDCGRECCQERQGHQLAHARCPRVM